MIENLLIIESPNKEKTIKKYLGANYEIIATVGHIRDLPKSNKVAFDPETFEPNWKISSDPKTKKAKTQIINEINKKAEVAKKIFIATDPDREGEAIAWHVFEILSDNAKKKCSRITFNEISKDAIKDALKHERKIDMNWVHSQFTRRILDRIIGYDLSKFVHSKFSGSSAGRVQSVALKFIYEREQEIKKFKPIVTYTLDVFLENDEKIFLRRINDKTRDENDDNSILEFSSKQDVDDVIKKLGDTFEVYYPKGKEDVKIKRHNPPNPFKTSTLQQTASNIYGWSISKITKIIQDLYEGIKIGNEQIALITYPRTDSIRMSNNFKIQAKRYIKNTFGDEYVNLLDKSNNIKGNNNVQDAHECIRVIDPFLFPSKLKQANVNSDYFKMYDLIWKRSIASLMTPSRYIHKIIRFKNNNCKFFTYSNTIEFDGFRAIYPEKNDVKQGSTKIYSNGQKIKSKQAIAVKHITEPPARYNQASLVGTLDNAGVGRPSTYRLMVDINPKRGYCEVKNKVFYMTILGNAVIEGLINNFNDVIDKDFTKKMEERLDAIAENKEPWNKWLKVFIPQFENKIANKNFSVKVTQLNVGRKCPKCGGELIYKFSKKTKKQFIGCINFPKCKYFEMPGVKVLDTKCPKCGHNLVERTSKRNTKFIGCSNYPNCNFIAKNLNELENIKK